jgi:O-antigen/teichoic acid export membrane protein
MILPGWLAGKGAGIFARLDGSDWVWMAVAMTVVATLASIIGVRFMRARPKHERKRGAKKNKVSATPAE